MDQLKKKLNALESDWMELLFAQLRTSFSGIHLPSHDHWHHYRVWQFVKIILAHLEGKGVVFNNHELTNLMLASLFHDVGLTQTLDEWHGKAGADICREFIESHKLNQSADLSTALEAIEKHDDKQYNQTLTRKGKPSLLAILSTADDLDAFGFIGVVRYAEIYLLRNTNIEDVSDKVLNNADRRFLHFSREFYHFKVLVEQQRQRYESLVDFYKSVNPSPASNNHPGNMLRHIRNNIENRQNNSSLTDLLNPIDSEYIQSFKDQIIKEHNHFRNDSMDQFT
ncbi:MAG: HD domain-containing protein [Bacteroidales bacterium]